MNIPFAKTTAPQTKPSLANLPFGSCFSDHMFQLDYNKTEGWHNPRIEPYGPLPLEPATLAFHYGQTIFEGMKAYRTEQGAIQLFRPQDNISRLNNSAKKLCMPELPKELILQGIAELVQREKEWVPNEPGTSLYIRPTLIATEPTLNVVSSSRYRFFVILSPVGPYYPEGFNPVKIWITEQHVRAVRGGIGAAKAGANYAASLYAGEEAHKAGFSQVLWLDGVEQRYIEEVGSMNIFFVLRNTLVTPELNGSILPGITRDSVLKLADHWGLAHEERRISIDELLDAQQAGELQEVFGSGTAAVISPVNLIRYKEREFPIGNGEIGTLTKKFFDSLTAIQYGRCPDPFGWIFPVCSAEENAGNTTQK